MGEVVSLTAEKKQEVVDITKFSPEDQKKAKDISQEIDVTDSQSIIQYGVSAQKNIADFSDSILEQVRAKDSGYVGEVLSDLVIKVKDINVDSLSEGNFISKIPIIGGIFDSFQKFITRYNKLSVQIEKIVDELDKSQMSLLKDITLLDNLYKKNEEYLQDLDIFIAAGDLKIKELRETVLPEMKKKADESNDPADAQKMNDFSQFLNRFEKKIHDLKLSRMLAIQTSPQIRLIQNNDQLLVEKIQSSILNTIPLWKNQIVIAISIFKQRKALQLQKEVTDTTNDLLQKNSEMLKQNSLEVAKESERGIIEIETLKKVNNDLVTTIEETLRIQADGRAKRAQAEQELVSMETELKNKLKEVR